MNRSGRFDLWISGILAVVCLVLLSGLVRQIQKSTKKRLAITYSARTVSVAKQSPTSSPKRRSGRLAEPATSSNAVKGSLLHPQARIELKFPASKPAKRIVSNLSAEAQLSPISPPQPKTITLEPLGYAEKADGRVEAIISVEDHVEVAHEGEIVEGSFRVARISSSAVELVENSGSTVTAQVTAESGQGRAQAYQGKSPQAPSSPEPGVASNIDASHPLAVDTAPNGSQQPVSQALGYVERADGRVEAIIAEGQQVLLSHADKSFATEFHGPPATPANVEVANAPGPSANPADSAPLESQPLQTVSSTHEPGGEPAVASGPGPSTPNIQQMIPGSNEESEFESPGIVQPEALADYAGNRFEPRGTASVPSAPVPGVGSVRPVLKGDATQPPPSDESGNHAAVRTLGYVEKTGGEKEAIVEVFDQVYLVREGELFAGKYRALHVTPSSVEIVEEPKQGSGVPPQKIDRGSGDVRPPVSQWRGPPLPLVPSRADPAAEIGETQKLAAAKPVASVSKPPPERPGEARERPEWRKSPRAGLEDVRLAGRPTQTDTRSPPDAVKTLGLVEKASGETEAIVADGEDVYVVPSGKVLLDNSKIPKVLPVLGNSPLRIQGLTIPGPLSELPAATFQIESTQARR